MDLNASLVNSNEESFFNITDDHTLRMTLTAFDLLLIPNDGSFGMIKMPQDYLSSIE